MSTFVSTFFLRLFSNTLLYCDVVCVCVQSGVSGQHCEECVFGHFGLSAENPDGCCPCFCSGLSQNCEEQSGFIRIPVSTTLTLVLFWEYKEYIALTTFIQYLSTDNCQSILYYPVTGQSVQPTACRIRSFPTERWNGARHPTAQRQWVHQPTLLATAHLCWRNSGNGAKLTLTWYIFVRCTKKCTNSKIYSHIMLI